MVTKVHQTSKIPSIFQKYKRVPLSFQTVTYTRRELFLYYMNANENHISSFLLSYNNVSKYKNVYLLTFAHVLPLQIISAPLESSQIGLINIKEAIMSLALSLK